MSISTPTKGSPKQGSLVVCAGTITCKSVNGMGAGFVVFKKLFKDDNNWANVLNKYLAAYHNGNNLPAFMNIANANGFLGGVATVPVNNSRDLNPITSKSYAEQYKDAVRGAVLDAIKLQRPLFIQPLGIGVYGWDPAEAAKLFAEVINQEDPNGVLDITIPIFDDSVNSKDSIFRDTLHKEAHLLLTEKEKLSVEVVNKEEQKGVIDITTSIFDAPENSKDLIFRDSLDKKVYLSSSKTSNFNLPKIATELDGNNRKSIKTEVKLVAQFYKMHKSLQQSKNIFYRFFIQSHWHETTKSNSIDEILRHAIESKTTLGYRNRSFKACEQLGWLIENDGIISLNLKAPQEINDAYEILNPCQSKTFSL